MQKGFLALMSAALLFSCSQIEPFEMEGDDMLFASVNNICVTENEDTWQIRSISKDASYQPGQTVTVRVYNSPTTLYYEFSSNTSINTITLNGQTISGNTFSEALPTGWNASTPINISAVFTRAGSGGGGGNAATVAFTYFPTPVCPESECRIINESAYAGNTVGDTDPGSGQGNNNAWWYAFDITGDAVQNVYQNGNIIGEATLTDGVITISLNDGWDLSGSESVKWYSYAAGALPSGGRPTPGQAPNKGSSLSIETSSDQYYVIHLDIQKEICN